MNHLKRAVQICGGQTALARAIGARQQDVWYWLNKAKKVPAEHCLPIEAATSHKVMAHDLRPDVFPANGQAA